MKRCACCGKTLQDSEVVERMLFGTILYYCELCDLLDLYPGIEKERI